MYFSTTLMKLNSLFSVELYDTLITWTSSSTVIMVNHWLLIAHNMHTELLCIWADHSQARRHESIIKDTRQMRCLKIILMLNCPEALPLLNKMKGLQYSKPLLILFWKQLERRFFSITFSYVQHKIHMSTKFNFCRSVQVLSLWQPKASEGFI